MITGDDKQAWDEAVEMIHRAAKAGAHAVIRGTMDDDGAAYVIATSDALAGAGYAYDLGEAADTDGADS